MLNDSPATGLAAISSTTRKVSDLTLMVEKFAPVPSRSELPANDISTLVKPSGWVNGIV